MKKENKLFLATIKFQRNNMLWMQKTIVLLAFCLVVSVMANVIMFFRIIKGG